MGLVEIETHKKHGRVVDAGQVLKPEGLVACPYCKSKTKSMAIPPVPEEVVPSSSAKKLSRRNELRKERIDILSSSGSGGVGVSTIATCYWRKIHSACKTSRHARGKLLCSLCKETGQPPFLYDRSIGVSREVLNEKVAFSLKHHINALIETPDFEEHTTRLISLTQHSWLLPATKDRLVRTVFDSVLGHPKNLCSSDAHNGTSSAAAASPSTWMLQDRQGVVGSP